MGVVGRRTAFYILFVAVFVNISGASVAPVTIYSLDNGAATEQMNKDSARPVVGAALPGDVPSYLWYYGCSPTSGSILVGYWDSKPGYQNLFDGDASVENAATRAMIASQAHITAGAENGYTYGDWHNSSSYPNHQNNPDCMADFMHTVNSGSYPANVASGLKAYVEWDNPSTSVNESYQATALNIDDPYWGGSFTYSSLQAEVDAGRPVLLDVYTYHSSAWYGHSIVCLGYQDSMFTVCSAAGTGNIIVPGIAVEDTWQNGTNMSQWTIDTNGDNKPDSYYNSYIDPFGVEWWPYYTDSDAGASSYAAYWDWSIGDAVTLDIIVPEPATILLLTLGSIALVRKS